MSLLKSGWFRRRHANRTSQRPERAAPLGAACMVALGLLAAISEKVAAQQNAVTVQLPTYRFFSISTTVSVPDRGGTAMGGIGRSALGANQFGPAPLPAGTRAMGWERQAQNVHVFAQVHDFQAMEQALTGTEPGAPGHRHHPGHIGRLTVMRAGAPGLASEANSSGGAHLSAAGGDNPLAVHTAHDAAGQLSVADWKRLRAKEDFAAQRQVTEWIERAAQAAAAGNRGAARVYLTMAYRKASADVRPRIAAELERLDGAAGARASRPAQ